MHSTLTFKVKEIGQNCAMLCVKSFRYNFVLKLCLRECFPSHYFLFCNLIICLNCTYPVPCQVGTYGLDYTCYECPIGAYQDVIGQSSCVKCPPGLTTKDIGSFSLSQCSGKMLMQLCDPFWAKNVISNVSFHKKSKNLTTKRT